MERQGKKQKEHVVVRQSVKWMLVMGIIGLVGAGLCGCGGGSGGGGDKEHKDYNHKPSFDCSGSWDTELDGTHVGTTTLQMDKEGDLTGTMDLSGDGTASLTGHLNAYAAEWTVSFEHVLYLVSMKFDSSEKYGDGTMVTSEGISHTLILKR
jgi:hypothetical protein